MPRGYFKKRKGYFTRRAKKPTYASKAFVKKTKKVVKKMLAKELEMKHTDVTFTGVAVTATAQYTNLTSLIAQSIAATDARIGDRIRLKKLMARLRLVYSDAAGNSMRIIIFRNKQDSVLGMNDFKIFDVNFSANTANFYLNPIASKDLSADTPTPISVFYDRTFTLIPTDKSETQNVMFEINLKNALLQFDASSLNGAGHVYMCIVSDSTSAVGGHPSVDGIIQTYYTDA